MNNSIWSKIVYVALIFGMAIISMAITDPVKTPPTPSPIVPPPIVAPVVPPPAPPAPIPPSDPELAGLQVPIPKEMRVFNKSGSQCVWCSAEILGRYHNVLGLSGLTEKYSHATGPREFGRVMTRQNVKFKQVTGQDLDFLDEWVTQKKMGAGIGVNRHHVIVVCHFERNKLVKIIDNADPSLRVQTWDWPQFTRNFSGWCFVVLPDNSPNVDWNNDVDDGRIYGGLKNFTFPNLFPIMGGMSGN